MYINHDYSIRHNATFSRLEAKLYMNKSVSSCKCFFVHVLTVIMELIDCFSSKMASVAIVTPGGWP